MTLIDDRIIDLILLFLIAGVNYFYILKIYLHLELLKPKNESNGDKGFFYLINFYPAIYIKTIFPIILKIPDNISEEKVKLRAKINRTVKWFWALIISTCVFGLIFWK